MRNKTAGSSVWGVMNNTQVNTKQYKVWPQDFKTLKPFHSSYAKIKPLSTFNVHLLFSGATNRRRNCCTRHATFPSTSVSWLSWLWSSERQRTWDCHRGRPSTPWRVSRWPVWFAGPRWDRPWSWWTADAIGGVVRAGRWFCAFEDSLVERDLLTKQEDNYHFNWLWSKLWSMTRK